MPSWPRRLARTAPSRWAKAAPTAPRAIARRTWPPRPPRATAPWRPNRTAPAAAAVALHDAGADLFARRAGRSLVARSSGTVDAALGGRTHGAGHAAALRPLAMEPSRGRSVLSELLARRADGDPVRAAVSD